MPKKQKTGGFKWKEKKPRDDDSTNDRDSGRLERGYRNRSPRRDSYRERERDRDRSPRRDRADDRYRDREQDRDDDRYRDRDQRRETDTYRPRDRSRDRERDSERKDAIPDKSNKSANAPKPDQKGSKSSEEPKKKKKPKSSAPSEPMIIVNINDRLGTKAAIPCLASDSIKAFKAVVAAHIGRQPHEIMLKRQGERPFKDQLTLQDYGVSNGVQLDLELDTGD
jgi:hypothetical protein